jgi:hypothetical protein
VKQSTKRFLFFILTYWPVRYIFLTHFKAQINA